jgi:hypothetical protein
VTVALGERRLDRAAEIARRLSLLRGSDPARGRAAFAQLAQLARVDVLVAFVERAGALSVWWFDADRGDFVGAPTHLALPAN